MLVKIDDCLFIDATLVQSISLVEGTLKVRFPDGQEWELNNCSKQRFSGVVHNVNEMLANKGK